MRRVAVVAVVAFLLAAKRRDYVTPLSETETNEYIGRFLDELTCVGRLVSYMDTLVEAFNPQAAAGRRRPPGGSRPLAARRGTGRRRADLGDYSHVG